MSRPAPLMQEGEPLLLASASAARKVLLENAGLHFRQQPASVDEEEIKAALRAEGAGAGQVAETLAELKAGRISRANSAALVIGADQMLDCEGRWFDKPGTAEAAAGQLAALAGRTHTLETSVCVLRDGQRLWHHNARAHLTMRPLSAAFIEHYLAAAGEACLKSVGGYQLEGLGAQLFSRVEGDFFTILGLPLLPLLDFLRARGVLLA